MTSKLPDALCDECPLKEEPLVPPSGPLDAKLIVIGEAPGATEVEQGKPFVGPSGTLLDYALTQASVDLAAVYKTNVVMCRPPNNQEPPPEAIHRCMPRLAAELLAVKGPVLALGKTATEALEMEDHARGHEFEWFGRKAMHTYHPAYLLRKPGESPIFLNDVKRFVSEPVKVNPKWLDPEVVHVQDPQELYEILERVDDGTWVAFDTETDQIRWFRLANGTPPDPMLMLQIAWDDEFGIVLDDVMLYDVPETREILQKFFSRVKTVAHNGKFDQIFLKTHIGVDVHLDFDTMLAHGMLDENGKHGLKILVTEYFGIPDYEEALIAQYLNNRNDRYSKVPFEPLAKYGVIDVIMTLQLRKLFENKLTQQGRMDWPFRNVIMRGANNFVDIEIRGVSVDAPYLFKAQRFLELKMQEETAACCEAVGIPDINLASPQQVAHVVYDMLGFPLQRSRKLGPRSTNHEAMEPLAGKHPFIDHLIAFRRIAKMKSSYADNLLEAVDDKGRVHATFQMIGTEVGRLSARNPALQTIPRPDDVFGALIRGAFTAAPGKMLLVVDYSQAELRVAAVEANEPFLFDVYEHDRDLHSEVAKAMYGPEYTKAQRVRCKMFNFSYLYGGSEYSFARDAGLPIHVARQFVTDYNRVMPNLAEYRRTQFKKLADHGFVQSRFGRRRNFEIITKVNMDDARKACVHAPIAGTASDLTLLAACELEEQGYEVVLLVHDSVVLEVPIEDISMVSAHATQVMVSMGEKYLPEVKWKADAEERMRWADPPTEILDLLTSYPVSQSSMSTG